MKKSLLLFLLSFLFFQVSRAQVIASFVFRNCDTTTGECGKPQQGNYYFYDANCLKQTDIFIFGNPLQPSNVWTEIKYSSDNLTETRTTREWDGATIVKNYNAPLINSYTNTYDVYQHLLKSIYTNYTNPNPLYRTTTTIYNNIYDEKQRIISGVSMQIQSGTGNSHGRYERYCSYDAEGYIATDDNFTYSADGKLTSKSNSSFSRSNIGVSNCKSSVRNNTYTYFWNETEQTSQSKDSTVESSDGLTYESYYFRKDYTESELKLVSRSLNTVDKINTVTTAIHQSYLNGQFVNNLKIISALNYSTSSNWKNNAWVITSRSDNAYGCNHLDTNSSPILVEKNVPVPIHIDTDVSQLKFTPNPASSYVYLQNAAVNNIGDGLVRVFNTVGQLVKTEKITYLPYPLDVSNLTSGTYILNFTGNSSSIKQKIYIQN